MSFAYFALHVLPVRAKQNVRIASLLLLTALSVTTLSASAQQQSHDTARAKCPACQNFYQYANQAWLDSASIPAASGDWGVWSANDARVTSQLHDILQSAAAAQHSSAQSFERVPGMFYAACMDSARIEAVGVRALGPTLAGIDSIATRTDVAREFGRLHRDGITAGFSFSSEVNRTGSLHYVADVEPLRAALAAGDFATADSASARRRAVYADHIARTLVLAGESTDGARHDAVRVMSIDSALANTSMTRVQEANASLQQMYRAFPFAELKKLTPGFSWDAYLRERSAPEVQYAIVPQPAFISAFARLVAVRPVADWRAYLRWRVLSDASPFLSAAFAAESFRFSQQSSGAAAQTPRWQRCARETGSDLPELVGRAYVEHTFSPSSKARVAQMVREIRAVLVKRLDSVPWLTASTRRQSLEKARTFGVKIAYPDRWHDYSGLRITSGPFITERAQARRFESERLMKRIGSAPDRAEWDFHGQYYFVPQSPTAWANWDEIIFPAAYLQAPLYDSTADLATNYAGIGVVIAHEMTHLFTADGSDIDAAGRIRHWWTPTDSARFAVIQNRLVHQYDQYTVLDSATHVNGSLTLGENLADVGGVELAYAAMERATARQRATQLRLHDDMSAERRFFLAYAHARVSKSRPEYLRHQVASDGHSPSMFRVNGPLSNFAPFAAQFDCKPGDPMARPDSVRVRIW